jgi:WD40 repeat protein
MCSASADGTVKVFDLRSSDAAGAPATILEIPDAAASETVTPALFRGDYEVISCGDDYCIKRWDQRSLKKGPITAFFGHVSPVKCITLSPDERFIVSGTLNGSVRIWLADEQGLLAEKEQESALSKFKLKVNKQQELFMSGEMDSKDMEEYKASGAIMEELDADLRKWQAIIGDRQSLACTQASLSLDGPTLPMSSLAWRDVDGKSRIGTGCQDPFARVYDVDSVALSDSVGRPRGQDQ